MTELPLAMRSSLVKGRKHSHSRNDATPNSEQTVPGCSCRSVSWMKSKSQRHVSRTEQQHELAANTRWGLTAAHTGRQRDTSQKEQQYHRNPPCRHPPLDLPRARQASSACTTTDGFWPAHRDVNEIAVLHAHTPVPINETLPKYLSIAQASIHFHPSKKTDQQTKSLI